MEYVNKQLYLNYIEVRSVDEIKSKKLSNCVVKEKSIEVLTVTKK